MNTGKQTGQKLGDITAKQMGCIRALIAKLKMPKEEVISSFTAGRTTHTSEMSKREGIELIQFLKSKDPDEASAELQRRYIIAMAHEIGWETSPGKADMKRIDGWCKQFGYGQKGLNSYLQNELPKLVTQFRDYVYKPALEKI